MKSTFGKSLLQGREDYSPKAKKLLEKYDGKRVKKVVINRTPLNSFLMGVLNAITFGQFKKKMKGKPYDKLFHLRMDLHTESGVVSIEKNEVVTLVENPKTAKNAETMEVKKFPKNMTLRNMLELTRNIIGNYKFFKYQAKDLNCQQFILDILTTNKLGDAKHRDFVKQDTNSLFDKYNGLRKTANTLTDIAAKFDVIKQGGQIAQDTPMKERQLLTQDLEKVFDKYDKPKLVKGEGFLEDAGAYADEINAEFQNIVGGGFFDDIGQNIKRKLTTPKGRREYAKSIIPPDIKFIARQRAWEYSPANIDRRLDSFVGSGFIDVVGALLKGLDNIRKGERNRAISYRDLARI